MLASCLAAWQGNPPFIITPEIRAALDSISPDSLKKKSVFPCFRSLEGRATPSPGLDIAAEYIAAQFRRAGLEPAGTEGYFQTAKLMLREQSLDDFSLAIESGEQSMSVPKKQVTLQSA